MADEDDVCGRMDRRFVITDEYAQRLLAELDAEDPMVADEVECASMEVMEETSVAVVQNKEQEEITRIAAPAVDIEVAVFNAKSRIALAYSRPRDWGTVQASVLKSCERPGFAKRSRYKLKMGKDTIVGPTIRLAEELARKMGNMSIATTIVSDMPTERIMRVAIMDLEVNLTDEVDRIVEKSVERSYADGRIVLSQRRNAKGYPVFRVVATVDEVTAKVGIEVSKMKRNLIMALVPRDVIDEIMEAIAAVEVEDAKRAGSVDKLIAAFAKIKVTQTQLEEHLGHSALKMTPEQIAELRMVWTGIKDGASTWDAWIGKEEAPEELKKLAEKLDTSAWSKEEEKSEG